MLVIKTYLTWFSSFEISFFCFLRSSRSLSASACSLTARSLSRRNLSQSVRILSLSRTILSRSLNAQSRLLFDTSASWMASGKHIEGINSLQYRIPEKIIRASAIQFPSCNWISHVEAIPFQLKKIQTCWVTNVDETKNGHG